VDSPPRFSKTDPAGDQGASGFMVGIKPIWGLPVGPWAVAIFIVESEVVPQQSFFGQ
jgi:hypothetical protein